MTKDVIYNKTCLPMTEVEDESVALMVTSPPYNVGKEYETKVSWDEHFEFLSQVWKEAHKKLIPGGRFAINVANIGRNPYVPVVRHVTEQLLSLGMVSEGEIIWQKPIANSNGSCAWGSWCMPSNPILEDRHEYVLIFRKGKRRRNLKDISAERKTASELSKEDFLKFRSSTWEINTAPRKGHPSAFPLELPKRLIQLYTFTGDLVLDPFMGSGTTAVAATQLNRHYLGYEIALPYCELAARRLKNNPVSSEVCA